MIIALAIAMVWLDVSMYLQYMNLYQASMRDKSKRVEIHATKNAFVEINNALVKKIPLTLEVAKLLEILNFFENPDSHDNPSNLVDDCPNLVFWGLLCITFGWLCSQRKYWCSIFWTHYWLAITFVYNIWHLKLSIQV